MHSIISINLFYQLTRNNQCPTSFAICSTGKENKIAKTFGAVKDIGEEQTFGDPPSSLHSKTNNAAWLFILPSPPLALLTLSTTLEAQGSANTLQNQAVEFQKP